MVFQTACKSRLLIRNLAFAFLILCLNGVPAVAQTDYTFVLEKPPAGNDIAISTFTTLVAALVTDVDTLSVVCFSDKATYLFSPLPGNTPELVKVAAEKLRSDPLKGTVTAAGISAGIALADEQAGQEAWGREGAVKRLIIITGSGSAGKVTSIAKPATFENNVYYISIGEKAERVKSIVDIAGEADDETFFWPVDARNTDPDTTSGYVSLAKGIYDCINVIMPNQYKEARINSDFTNFSAGKLSKGVVFIENSFDGSVDMVKSGKKIANLSVFPHQTYTVIQIVDEAKGNYSVSNGKILFAFVKDKSIPWAKIGMLFLKYWWLVLVVVCAIAGIILGMQYKPALRIDIAGVGKAFIAKHLFFISGKKKIVGSGTSIGTLIRRLKPEIEKNNNVIKDRIVALDKYKICFLKNKNKWVVTQEVNKKDEPFATIGKKFEQELKGFYVVIKPAK